MTHETYHRFPSRSFFVYLTFDFEVFFDIFSINKEDKKLVWKFESKTCQVNNSPLNQLWHDVDPDQPKAATP